MYYSFWQIRKEKIIAFARSIRSNKRKVLVGWSGDETTEKRKKVDKNKKRKKKREKKMRYGSQKAGLKEAFEN